VEGAQRPRRDGPAVDLRQGQRQRRPGSGDALQRLPHRRDQRRRRAGLQLRRGRGGHGTPAAGRAAQRHEFRVDRADLPADPRRQYRDIRLPALRAAGLPGPGRPVRDRRPGAGGDPDRADDAALRDRRGDPGRQRQQRVHPDRPDRTGGPGVQERHPAGGVRQGQTGRRHGPPRRGAGSLPLASAADPDDQLRLHHGRGAAGAVQRRRRRDAPRHGRRGVFRDAWGDLLRAAADPGVLSGDPRLRREARGAQGGIQGGPRMKFFALSLLALAVTGCAVGPDYRAPQPEPARIAHAEDSDYDRSRFESAWWHQFEDPTLDALVVQALTENRELRIAYSRLRAARAIRDDDANDRFPTVTAGASADIGQAQQPGVTERRINAERYDLGLDMAWELDLFGRIQRRLEASDAQAEAAEAELYQLQVSLIAELVDAYGQLRGAQLRERIARDNLA